MLGIIGLVVVVLLGLAGIACVVGGISSQEGGIAAGGVGAVVVAGVILAILCTTIVPPRTVGVAVSFGKPVGTMDNGLHAKAPWTSVEKLDGSVQNDVFNGDNTITVRLGNNSRAEVDASIRWQLKTDNAESLFLDYKTFDSIGDNLVTRNFRAALNESFADYNPLASVEESNNNKSDELLANIGEEVAEKLRAKIGDDITVHEVTIPIVRFDESTQGKIDELQAEIARTRVAEQKQDTADAERKANEILDRSVSDNVLTSKCLDIVERHAKSPLGCFPGASGQPIIEK